MKLDFPLHDPGNSLLAAIADTIKRYYPGGIDIYSDDYSEHPARVEVRKIIDENFMWHMAGIEQAQAGKAFSTLFDELKQYSSNELLMADGAMGPGFSVSVVLEKYLEASLERIKRIAFAVSAFGPFFSVCGIDETIITLDGIPYPAINVVTKSPYKEFEDWFKYLEQLVKKHFPDYKFVPFEICMMVLKDVEIPFWAGHDDTVYAALFNMSFQHYGHTDPRGEWYKGMGESL